MDLSALFQALQASDKIAAEQSPYRPLEEAGSGIGQLVLQQSAKAKPKDALVAGLLSGLFTGGMQNLSSNYRESQNNMARDVLAQAISGQNVTRPSGMNASVFGNVRDAGALYGASRMQEQANLQMETGEVIKREMAKAMIQNPEAAPQIADAMRQMSGEAPVARPIAEPIVEPDPLGMGPTYKSRFDDAMRQARSRGLTGNASLEYAQTLLKPDALANAQSEKTLQSMRDKLAAKESVIQTAEAAISGAGQTGGIMNAPRNLASRVSAAFGDTEQIEKQAFQQQLESLAPEIIAMTRTPGVGAMSDPEMRAYLGAGPSADKTPQENQMLIEKLKSVANMEKEYLDLVETVQATYGTTKGADKIWREYKAANPLFVNVGGQMVANTNRPSWREWLDNPTAASAPADMPGGQPISRQGASDMVTIRNKRTGQTMQVPRSQLGG